LTTRATVNISSTLRHGGDYLNCTLNYFMQCISNGHTPYPLHQYGYKD